MPASCRGRLHGSHPQTPLLQEGVRFSSPSTERQQTVLPPATSRWRTRARLVLGNTHQESSPARNSKELQFPSSVRVRVPRTMTLAARTPATLPHLTRRSRLGLRGRRSLLPLLLDSSSARRLPATHPGSAPSPCRAPGRHSLHRSSYGHWRHRQSPVSVRSAPATHLPRRTLRPTWQT